CFVAGTLVHTPNGLQAIETLKIGDEVFAFDEESGQKVTRKVTETFINQTTTIIKITDSKGEVIETTWNHPFYVTAGMWVKAKDLMVGDEFLTIDGREIKVASIQESIRDEKVYNLEVEDAHTYYVGKGGVLVHNAANYNKTTGIFESNRYTFEQTDTSVLNKLFNKSSEPGLLDKLLNKIGVKDLPVDNGVLENNRVAVLAMVNSFPDNHKFVIDGVKYTKEQLLSKKNDFFSADNPQLYKETTTRAFKDYSAREINLLPEGERQAARDQMYKELTDVTHTTQWGANNGLKLQMSAVIEYMRVKFGPGGENFKYDPSEFGQNGQAKFEAIKSFIFSSKDSFEVGNSFGAPICFAYSSYIAGIMNGSFEGSLAEFMVDKFRKGDLKLTDDPYGNNNKYGETLPNKPALVRDEGRVNPGSYGRGVELPVTGTPGTSNTPLAEDSIRSFLKNNFDSGNIKEGSIIRLYVDNNETPGANHYLTAKVVKDSEGNVDLKIYDHTNAKVNGVSISKYLDTNKIHQIML
ncbi:polymorphic toxin-type HINT domain-containing protein, partial [Leptospira licerasiae]|uniref:polymorphic toxin-type HINT domain-containing protein n=1 Tax=Leptospira licerasiae TaxID=447106 RepID=UPI0011026CCA